MISPRLAAVAGLAAVLVFVASGWQGPDRLLERPPSEERVLGAAEAADEDDDEGENEDDAEDDDEDVGEAAEESRQRSLGR